MAFGLRGIGDPFYRSEGCSYSPSGALRPHTYGSPFQPACSPPNEPLGPPVSTPRSVESVEERPPCVSRYLEAMSAVNSEGDNAGLGSTLESGRSKPAARLGLLDDELRRE